MKLFMDQIQKKKMIWKKKKITETNNKNKKDNKTNKEIMLWLKENN